MPKKPPTHDPKGRTPEQRLGERRKATDARRDKSKPWRKLYTSARWRALRAYILRRDPSCILCLSEGKTTPACIADHIVEHEGNEVLFWDTHNVWGLCATCHSSIKQRLEYSLKGLSKETVQGVYEYLRNIFAKYVMLVDD